MSFSIRRTSAPVGAIITGLDLDGLSRGEASDLYRAFLEYGVLVFKGMKVDDAGQIRLSNLFGEGELHPLEYLRLKDQPFLVDFASNGGQPVADDDPEADTIVNRLRWHTDSMYTETPLRGGLLRPIVLPPEGGDTGWIDTTAVYRALPYRIKVKIQGLQLVCSYAQTGGKAQPFPEVVHPLVFVHPEMDLPVLNITPSSAVRLLGLPPEEGAELLQYLIDFATRDELAYRHHWEPGDMVIWDNWRTMHRTYGHKKRYPRVVRRTSLKPDMRLGRYIDSEG